MCPLCKAQDNVGRFSERGYLVRMCHNCGLFFVDPYSRSDRVHTLVHDYDYADLEVLEPEKNYQAEVKFYERYFSFIDRECIGATSLLDVGCGTGHLLERLRHDHPALYRVGIELNAARAEMALSIARCEIYQVPVEKFASERNFDVITMINVLSHIPSFDDLFNSIRLLLSPNGKLVLKVGELDKDVRKRDLHDWGIPDHLHFLGLKTLHVITEKYGLSIAKHDRVSYSDEAFSETRFRTLGRSRVRNAMKRVCVGIPFALRTLKFIYDSTHGSHVYSSFIVLTQQVSPAAGVR